MIDWKYVKIGTQLTSIKGVEIDEMIHFLKYSKIDHCVMAGL